MCINKYSNLDQHILKRGKEEERKEGERKAGRKKEKQETTEGRRDESKDGRKKEEGKEKGKGQGRLIFSFLASRLPNEDFLASCFSASWLLDMTCISVICND